MGCYDLVEKGSPSSFPLHQLLGYCVLFLFMVGMYIGSTYKLQVSASGGRRKDKVGEKILATSNISSVLEKQCSQKPLTRAVLKQGSLGGYFDLYRIIYSNGIWN